MFKVVIAGNICISQIDGISLHFYLPPTVSQPDYHCQPVRQLPIVSQAIFSVWYVPRGFTQ